MQKLDDNFNSGYRWLRRIANAKDLMIIYHQGLLLTILQGAHSNAQKIRKGREPHFAARLGGCLLEWRPIDTNIILPSTSYLHALAELSADSAKLSNKPDAPFKKNREKNEWIREDTSHDDVRCCVGYQMAYQRRI